MGYASLYPGLIWVGVNLAYYTEKPQQFKVLNRKIPKISSLKISYINNKEGEEEDDDDNAFILNFTVTNSFQLYIRKSLPNEKLGEVNF